MHVFALLYRSAIPPLLALTLIAPVAGLYAPQAVAADLLAGATLDIVAAPVQVGSSQTGPFVDGVSGQLLGAGDVVRTGPGGVALLTFFDGSESQLASDSQLQVQRADYNPAPRIVLFQSAGVTINRVIPLPPGGSFETDTPTAIGLVRGTSYLVNVSAPTSAAAQPRSMIDATDDQLASTATASDDQLASTATTSDDQLASTATAGDDQVASTLTVSDDQGATRVAGSDDQVASRIAASDAQVASGVVPAEKPDVLSSIVLLTDRDGHVGHVQFNATALTAIESSPTATSRVELLHAGDVGATVGGTAVASQLLPADLLSLERAAADLHDVGLARQAASKAKRIADELAPRFASPGDGQNPTGRAESSAVLSTPAAVVQPPRADPATQRLTDGTAANQPASPASQPAATASQSAAVANQQVAATSQSAVAASQPAAATSQVAAVAPLPSRATVQPAASTAPTQITTSVSVSAAVPSGTTSGTGKSSK
jgi:hypothetical protein